MYYIFFVLFQGTDRTYVDKLNMKFDDNYHYEKSNHAGATSFTIKHYAGPVSVNC